jgi:error-prone DNA polymerase
VVFLNLEDETGMVNVICPPQVWQNHRRMARRSPALVVRGRIERSGGAVNLVAAAMHPLCWPRGGRPPWHPPLRVAAPVPSRDFR